MTHDMQDTIDCKQLITGIVAHIGFGVRELGFRIATGAGQRWTFADFAWTATTNGTRTVLHGQAAGIVVRWVFEREPYGCWVTLGIESDKPLHCKALESLIVTYAPQTGALDGWWALNAGATIHSVGLHRVGELDEQTHTDTLLRGVFRDSRTPGLLLGTRVPQMHLHNYRIAHTDDTFTCTATTRLTDAVAAQTSIHSETTWVCASLPVGAAVQAYAAHVPEQPVTPVVGWNSWDYYFFTVSLDALIENMDAIRRDPVLSQHIRYIVIDEGWEHKNGEWEPNYRFPGGLKRAAAEIISRGFIPGIWTAPILVDQFSHVALRQPELLLKNEHGDPLPADSGGHYRLDPTHPAGEALVTALYTRLYNAGFRLFKIDFVDELVGPHQFHRADLGPYDALRYLFATVRRCVSDASHILGCSLPAACGPGVADSGRIGIDIHNHWAHIEWVCDYLQLSYWQHGRIWANDPDFLIVRGPDTSVETTTNVTNPNAHNPAPPRWRRGADFTLAEAQTWASIVAMAGGNVVLSDRISQLSEAGHQLLAQVIEPTHVAAQPLDLCDDRRASLWLQTLPHERRLTVINWHDETVERVIAFANLFDHAPPSITDFWNERELPVHNGELALQLAPHASAVLLWHT